jgi:hypothetical protein
MKSMSGCGWQKLINWSYKLGLTGLVGLNLVAGLVVLGNDLVKPVLAQDRVFLYGEANTANQVGKGYLIFQRSGQQIVGAMYSPQSEYTCFTGQLTATNINLQPFDTGVQTASNQDSTQAAIQVALPSLHQLSQVGSADRQVLASCQKEASALQPSRTVMALPRS